MLKQHGQLTGEVKRVLEINPRHPLVSAMAKRISEKGAGNDATDSAWLLLDQARIAGGESVPDPAAFAKRMSDMMRRALDQDRLGLNQSEA
jgi:molecular chaperone HtpG